MNFDTVETNIVSILGAAAAGRFRVIGYQTQSDDAKEYLDSSRLVRVYYSQGEFPRGSGSTSGPVMHDTTYNIELIVSKSSEGDLATLNNPSATDLQRQTALAGVKASEQAANESWNELFGIVYNILMDGQNIDLNMPVGEIADRWISSSRKDEPGSREGIIGSVGGLVLISGILEFNIRMDEAITGETGTPGDRIYDTVIDIDNDDNERTGVVVDFTAP